MAPAVTLDDLSFPVAGELIRLEREGPLVAVHRISGERVGEMAVELLEDGLFVRSLCIDEAQRSYGAGSEAALLFNRACEAAHVPLVRTWAPPDRGLAVYFWIRMGFRPLHGEGPEGGLWFERRRE
jgi:hypothetical protein